MIKYYTKFLQTLAKRYIARHKPIVVGVTWSAGKSSAVAAIGAVLKQQLPDQQVYVPSRQLNGELGLPLTIFQVEYFGPTIKYVLTTTWKVLKQYLSQSKPYDIIVLEYGVDHVGEMDVLLDIVVPDYAVITNIDTVHFGDREITRQEKSKLIKASNNNYLWLEESIWWHANGNYKTFSIHNKQADIDLISYEYLMDNPHQAGMAWDVLLWEDMLEIVTNSIESYYLLYSAIGYDIALQLWAKSTKQLPIFLDLPASRATLLAWVHNSIIIDSSYNSSPIGVHHLLDTLTHIRAQHPDYAIMCLMWEMRELYELSQSEHHKLAQSLIAMDIDYIWLVWESAHNYMYDHLVDVYGEDRVMYNDSSISIGQRALDTIVSEDKNTIILVKWSQNTVFMEEAVKLLLATNEDESKLCRQSSRWMSKKKHRFESVKTL